MSWKDSLPDSAKAYIGERQLDEVECIISDFPGVARGKAVPHQNLPNKSISTCPTLFTCKLSRANGRKLRATKVGWSLI